MKNFYCFKQKYKSISFFGFILITLFCSVALYGQDLQTAKTFPVELDEKANFFEIQKAMDEYWSSKEVNKIGYKRVNGVESKVPNWKLYKRWEYFWEQRVNLETGEFPKTSAIEEYKKQTLRKGAPNQVTAFNESWSNLGTNSSSGGYAGIGRINCIAFHPSDANTFWVGSPSGGIWRTTNGGTNWTILNDDESVIGVSCIVVNSDYATSNTIYIATGDRNGGSMSSTFGRSGS
jgi:hypothetical protein